MTTAEAERHLADGQFPAGSMGPKVARRHPFLSGEGRVAVITTPELAARTLPTDPPTVRRHQDRPSARLGTRRSPRPTSVGASA